MSETVSDPLYYDPYDIATWDNPYPVFKRMREEAPLYYNEKHNFYAVTRYDDVKKGLLDPVTFSSAKGNILEVISMDITAPRGIFIMEDPPLHTAHRSVLATLFSPKNIASLEPKIREFCVQCLDPLVGGDRLDFVLDLGARMPMRVIGMLLGIPDEDLESVRTAADAAIRSEERGKPMDYTNEAASGEHLAEYIEWRLKNPSDDIMTRLMNTEFKDEHGEMRKLTREEILAMVAMLAGAGNETTNRLIGWTGKVLAEHPDQRQQLIDDPSLIPVAIEEVLRFEPPGPHAARWVTRDTEFHGQKVPAGSAISFIIAAGNRDERQFEDSENFNINRPKRPHLTFGNGIHTCIGLALARLEARVAVEEVLKRFKHWDVDYDKAVLSATTMVRGWDSLPTVIGK